MLWAFLAAGFFLAATMGAALASLFTTIRPEWTRNRRLLIAASVLPAITFGLSAIAAVLFFATSDPSIRSTIVVVVLTWGAGFALLAFAGGFLGALTSARARKG